MLRSSLCNYSNTYILAKRTVTIANATDAYTANNVDKNVIFKNFAPFINCISIVQMNRVQMLMMLLLILMQLILLPTRLKLLKK